MANIIGLDLNIDENYLEQAVKQTVIAGISESLNGKNEIVSQIVNSVLTMKVDRNGRVSSYERDNKYTILQHYVEKALIEETKLEIKSQIDEQRSAIRKHIKKAITSHNFIDDISNAFIDCVKGNLESNYNTTVAVEFNKKKDDDC